MRFFILALLFFNIWTQNVVVTAYTASPSECGNAEGITASGEEAVEGVTVAADHLPLYTMIEMDGWFYIVQDRFGGGYENKIDVFMNNRQDAINFGRQHKTIKIYEWEG